MYSVVMVTRPHEPYILEAIASIDAQTLPADRIVVVVNGPGSAEADLVRAIPAGFPHVEVRTIPEPGMSGALALALPDIHTPFVAVLDADDLWEPQKQERQVARLLAEPALDAVFCEVVNFEVGPDGTVVEGRAARVRMFAATTFRTDAFARFGLPDAEADHFAWLYRWWTTAQAAGIVTECVDYRGLRRRVHSGNGWVTDRSEGRAVLLAELRRIRRRQREVEAASPGRPHE